MVTSMGSSSPGSLGTGAEPHATAELPRAIGSLGAIAIVVGTIIGSGIFMVPAQCGAAGRFRPHRDPGLGRGGALALAGSLSLAELGAATPEAGGVYIYLRDAYGKLAAFLYGWAALLVIESGGIATLAVAFGIYSSTFFPLTPLERKLVASAVIAVLTLVNIAGVKRASVVQTLLYDGQADGPGYHRWLRPVRPPPDAGCPGTGICAAAHHSKFVWGGAGGVLWAYQGWHHLSRWRVK